MEPRQNPDLIGHEEAEKIFLSLWESKNLPHSWLISGPKGLGKATMAFRFARFVLSNGKTQYGNTKKPLSALKNLFMSFEHPTFRKVAASSHPDLLTLEKTRGTVSETNKTIITIDKVRRAGEFLRKTPADGAWRILIVDSVDELNIHSANALLKILEEPPKQTLLLLINHTANRLLPTIRSRCCNLKFKSLETKKIETLLNRQRPNLKKEEVKELAVLSQGCPGRGIQLADQGGLELYRQMVVLLNGLPKLDTTTVYTLGNQLSRSGEEQSFYLFMELLEGWIGRLVVFRTRSKTDTLDLSPSGEEIKNSKIITNFKIDVLLDTYSKVISLTNQVEHLNLDRKLIFFEILSSLQGAFGGNCR